MTSTPTTVIPTTATSAAIVTTASGVRLGYDSFGNPAHPPLLLIQGLGAHMLGWHPGLCQLIADQGFFVVRHDNRDVGLSDKFPPGSYTLKDMANDSAEFLQALNLAPAHIVGQSMGGMIAQQIAIDHPHVVSSLALIYTTGHTHHILLDEVLQERQEQPAARNREEAIELYLLNEAHCATEAYPFDEVWLRQLGGLMYDRDNDPNAPERQLTAIYDSPDRRPSLPAVTAPTVILHGDGDRLIDPAASRELHDLIPDSLLTIYPGMGHVLPRPLWNDIVARIGANALRATHASASSGPHAASPTTP